MALIVHFDGGSRGNPGPAAAGVVIHDDAGTPLLEAGYFLGRMTNNQAEYNGLLHALDALIRLPDDEVVIYSDSELLVRQITGEYRVKSPDLKPLHEEAHRRLLKLDTWRIQHVRREKNRRADQLANRAMSHGGDVIEVELLGAGADAGPSSKPASKKPKVTAASPTVMPTTMPTIMMPSVIVRVTRASNPEVCPAPCPAKRVHTFDATVPEGLCVNAAHALLNTVLALQHVPPSDGEPAVPPMTVRCSRADCGAVFDVRCDGA